MKSEAYNRDCLDGMRGMASSSVSYVITSPPYNLREGMEDKGELRVGHGGSKWKTAPLREGYGTHSDDMPYPEYVRWQREILAECWRLLDDGGAIFYNHKPRVVKGELRTPLSLVGDLPVRQVIIWNRRSGFNYSNSFYMPKHEWVLLLAKPEFRLRDKGASGVGDVWDFTFDTDNPHPAPFPYELPKAILDTVARIDKPVLDPFLGSGTTRLAAHDARFDFVGYELDADYFAAQEERFERHISQPKLFIPDAEPTEQPSLI